MKVHFGNLVLARGLLFQESPSEFKTIIRKQVQFVPTVRANASRIFDRGNLKVEVTFCVLRQHDSIAEAIHYSLEHPSKIKEICGPMHFLTEADSETLFVLENGALNTVESYSTGTLSTHKYEFIGSYFSQILLEKESIV